MDLPPETTPQPLLLRQPPSGATVVKPETITIPQPNQSNSTPEPKETVLPLRPPAITIPSYSRWFSWTSIHETEEKLVPEFFDGKSPSRSPSFYKRIRDSIIRKYYEGSGKKITFTDVRRGLIADVGSVRKVFDFLETWGLINYTPPPVTKEKEKKKTVEKKGGNSAEGVAKKDNNTEDPATKTCSGCGAICSQACFSTEKTEIILCARCFVRGNYRAGLTSSDFKRLDIEEAAAAAAAASSSGGRASFGQIKSEWSEKETLHLLESVLHYGDDWKKVAEHVGNGRSQLECIGRFIKLPFGEQFMATVGGGPQDLVFSDNEKEEDDDDSNLAAKQMRLNPLADTSNPIMAQVALLSAMVGLDVADAAARAAVSGPTDDLVMDIGSHTNLVRKEEEPITKMEEDVGMEHRRKMLEEAIVEAKVQIKKEHEDLEQSISDIVNVQMKELHEKMDNFEAIELLMEKETSQLRQMQKLFFEDQLSSLQYKHSLETAVEDKIKIPPR